MSYKKSKIVNLSLKFKPMVILVFLSILACLVFTPQKGFCDIINLWENGEGYSNGQAIPGWIPVNPPVTSASCVTRYYNPSAVHSGDGAIRIHGDFGVGRFLDSRAKGEVTIDYWHFPKPGTSTNSFIKLYSGFPGESYELLTVHKNDMDKWWADGRYIADYSGAYTHVVIKAYTQIGLFDVFIDGNQVVNGRQVSCPAHLREGINFVLFHSGRGAAGTDSYIDDIKITSATPEPCTGLLLGSGLFCAFIFRKTKKHFKKV